MKDILTYINEMNANLLPADIQVNDDRHEEGGTLTISFGKNGWGLTTEFNQIGDIIKVLSRSFNVYLDECKIDTLDDVYELIFHYDNKNFDR